VGKLLYNFNVIAVPNEWVADDSTCPNSGHRMFFRRVASGFLGTILWTVDPTQSQSIEITDCDGTTDHETDIQVNGAGRFYVFARLLGPLHSSLDVTCLDDLLNENLCLSLGAVSLNRTNSKDFVKIMADLFADDLERALLGPWITVQDFGFCKSGSIRRGKREPHNPEAERAGQHPLCLCI
jgi:hypothetical protein